MKPIKKIFSVFFLLIVLVTCSIQTVKADTPTGDIAMNPIRMKQNDKIKTSMSKGKNIKYFNVVVEEAGILKIDYSTKELKKTVELSFDYGDGLKQFETKKIKYNKKKKAASGNIVTSQIVQPGVYTFSITSSDNAKTKTPFTIKTSLKKKNYDDKEPNNNSTTAQEMVVKSTPVEYNMFLSGTSYAPDVMDCFQFTLKKNSAVTITASTNTEADMVVFLKKKTDNGEEIVNSGSKNQTFTKSGKKYVFKYTSDRLEKGDYTITVWLRDELNKQIEYIISAKTK